MQNREAPPALAACASASTDVEVHQLLGLHAGVEFCRLRTVGAVFRAATGFDRQQSRNLHLGGIEILAVNLCGAEHQFWERQCKQRPHFFARPVVPKDIQG